MTKRISPRGFTLLELVLGMAIAVATLLVVGIAFRQANTVLTRSTLRSKAILESRTSVETFVRLLQNGKSGSWKISNPGERRPYCRVDFKSTTQTGAHAYYWKEGAVYIKPANQEATKLASNVTWLLFTGDSADPGLLRISLRMDVPIPGTTPYTILISNREVYLAS
jgi:hypothetical protein